jgi:hypothetical protein
MAIASNSSEKEVASGGGAPLYVGIAPVKIVAVNPTLAELQAIGINAKNDPEYLGVNIGGDEYNKVVLWVAHGGEPEFKTKIEFLVKPEAKVSQSGKTQWTNNIGQFAYAESKASEAYEWFKDEGVRKAFNGEERLLDFIKAFANVASGDDCYLETWKQVASGDVKEIKELVKALPDNMVRVLLGVKDGKYQQVYMKHFGRLKPMRDDLFLKNLNDDYGAFKAEYNTTLALEPYSPAAIQPDGDSAALPESMETGSDDGWL